MFRKMLFQERRVAQFHTILLFLILSVIFFTITFLIQLNANRINRVEMEVNEQSMIDILQTVIAGDIRGKTADLLFIADTLQLYGYESDSLSQLEEQWTAFSSRKRFYDQIRYIDRDGNEKIRVNYTDNGAEAVTQDALQNKMDRYYFIDTMALQRDQIYISELDLNVENDEIEQPIKPMLRLATPLFDRDGTPEGIAIVNYSADNTLHKIQSISSSGLGELYILNANGYWMFNSADSSKAWGFMYEDRQADSFANDFPAEWNEMVTNGKGIFETNNGIFIFTRFILDDVMRDDKDAVSLICDMNTYYLISYIPARLDKSTAYSLHAIDVARLVLEEYLSIYFLLSGVAFAMAAFIAVNKGQRKQIKYYSEYDTLTGVYNRRSAYEKMQEMKKSDTKSCRVFAVCFLDINGLKDINDSLGHDAGDELIKTVAEGIQHNIRDLDFVARLGGDEFLIVFEGLPLPEAEMIWERIVRYFVQINEQENRAYRISASHGISLFTCDESMSIDDVVNQADAKMYTEKREIKKSLRVIREKP